MADIETVVKALECCTTTDEQGFPRCEECPYADSDGTCPDIDAMHRHALELLKEQKPKLVRYTASTVRCPNCNKQITNKGCIHREINYCWKCGQAVKWDE